MNNVIHHPSFGVGMARQEMRDMEQNELTADIYSKAESLGIPHGLKLFVTARAHYRRERGVDIAACYARATLELMELAEAKGETA